MSLKSFGSILRHYRDLKNISQRDLAQKLGVAPSTIGMYERNAREPSFETIYRIAEVLDVPASVFFSEPVHSYSELLGGIGGIKKEPAPDQSRFNEMADMFNSLSEADQQKVLGYLAALKDNYKK